MLLQLNKNLGCRGREVFRQQGITRPGKALVWHVPSDRGGASVC